MRLSPRNTSRLLGPLGLALAAGLSAIASPVAAADSDLTISHIEQTPDSLQVLVGVPADAGVDLGSVTMSIDGVDTEASAESANSNQSVSRTAILVIDSSRSMSGARIEAAKQAAISYVDMLPDDVELGIVTFDDGSRVALEPTTDRDQARAVVSGLKLKLETSLYDGAIEAVRLGGTDGQVSLLVLSDGADTTDTPLKDATEAIENNDVLANVVSLGVKDSALQALNAIADAGNGQVLDGSPESLESLFAEEAAALSRQVLVTGPVPDSVTATEANVEVAFATEGGQLLSADAFATVQSEQPRIVVTEPAGDVIPDWLLWIGLVGLGFGLVVFLILMVPGGSAKDSAEHLVNNYVSQTTRGRKGKRAKESEDALAGAKDAASQILQRNQGLEVTISKRLQEAGSDLKAAEWLLLHTGIVVVATLAGLLLSGMSAIVGLIFMALGAVLPWLYLGRRRSKRRQAFGDQLPETLQLLSGALSAGLSLAQAVDTIVREGSEPMAGEFKRVLVESRLGVNVEDSMEGIAERFESKDFHWVVMAIRIQRQVGGNLAELLDTVAATMRERAYLRRQVRSLSAEGRLSAYVLGGLPPIFFLYLVLTNPDYVSPLFNDPRGIVMLAFGAGWLLVGAFWMKKMVDVEV
ncbi:MAG: type II secretion system F family protein [Nocardioides sp.]